jgi:hypothetical protein
MHGLQWDYSFPRLSHGGVFIVVVVVVVVVVYFIVTQSGNFWIHPCRHFSIVNILS